MANVAVRPPNGTHSLYDDFESGLLPGWVFGPADDFDHYHAVGGAMRDIDGHSRRSVSTSPPFEPEVSPELAVHPPEDGMIYAGIGYAGRHMPPDWRPDVEVTWSGLWDVHAGHHVEVTPLLWIDPDNPLGGFGCWPIAFGMTDVDPGAPLGLVGFIGSPPELFAEPEAPVIGQFGFAHTDGTPRKWRIRVNESDEVEILLDDVLMWSRSLSHSSFTSLTGFSSLTASNVHGVAIDQHYVRPISSVPTLDAVLDARFYGYPA